MSERGKVYVESNGKFYAPPDGVYFNMQTVGGTKFVFVNTDAGPGGAYENPKIEELVEAGWLSECEPPDTHERRVEKALRDLMDAIEDRVIFSGHTTLREAFARAKEVLSEDE